MPQQQQQQRQWLCCREFFLACLLLLLLSSFRMRAYAFVAIAGFVRRRQRLRVPLAAITTVLEFIDVDKENAVASRRSGNWRRALAGVVWRLVVLAVGVIASLLGSGGDCGVVCWQWQCKNATATLISQFVFVLYWLLVHLRVWLNVLLWNFLLYQITTLALFGAICFLISFYCFILHIEL